MALKTSLSGGNRRTQTKAAAMLLLILMLLLALLLALFPRPPCHGSNPIPCTMSHWETVSSTISCGPRAAPGRSTWCQPTSRGAT